MKTLNLTGERFGRLTVIKKQINEQEITNLSIFAIAIVAMLLNPVVHYLNRGKLGLAVTFIGILE